MNSLSYHICVHTQQFGRSNFYYNNNNKKNINLIEAKSWNTIDNTTIHYTIYIILWWKDSSLLIQFRYFKKFNLLVWTYDSICYLFWIFQTTKSTKSRPLIPNCNWSSKIRSIDFYDIGTMMMQSKKKCWFSQYSF